jgi:hypothetical protein
MAQNRISGRDSRACAFDCNQCIGLPGYEPLLTAFEQQGMSLLATSERLLKIAW